MEPWLQIILAVIGSSGLWAGIAALLLRWLDKKSAKSRMILGLGHDRIIWLCQKYIARGWITKDEYEDLHDYLYVPYKNMGGNGTAERLMKEVDRLPVRNLTYMQKIRGFRFFGKRRRRELI